MDYKEIENRKKRTKELIMYMYKPLAFTEHEDFYDMIIHKEYDFNVLLDSIPDLIICRDFHEDNNIISTLALFLDSDEASLVYNKLPLNKQILFIRYRSVSNKDILEKCKELPHTRRCYKILKHEDINLVHLIMEQGEWNIFQIIRFYLCTIF